MSRRVVITGLGPVTSTGIGRDEFFNNLFSQKHNFKKIPTVFDRDYHFKSRYYIPIPEFTLSDYQIGTRFSRIMQIEDRIALLGTKLALEDAGFTIEKKGRGYQVPEISDCGVILGIGLSGLEAALTSYLSHIFDTEKDSIALLGNDLPRYNRMIIPSTMPNSITAWTSIILHLTGVSFTINAACASGTIAIGESFRRIRDGYDNMIITGGVECLREELGSIMRGFDTLGALTKSPDGNPIPFSKNRSGFLFAEGGGCILVLEELENARKRGAEIYGEIIDYSINSDAFNIVKIDPSGLQIEKLLTALKGKRKIDYINTHGTGTEVNDEIEAQSIIKIFGDKSEQPYLNSTKGILGHTLGASGGIEAAVTAYSIKNSKIHGNKTPDPMENLNLVYDTINENINFAISTSYAFGGHNVGILFSKFID